MPLAALCGSQAWPSSARRCGRSVVKVLRKTLFERQTLYESILSTGSALGQFHLTGSTLAIASNMVALEDAYGHHVIAAVSVSRDQAEAFQIEFASTATQCDLLDAVGERAGGPVG